jgi:hypothetical protein
VKQARGRRDGGGGVRRDLCWRDQLGAGRGGPGAPVARASARPAAWCCGGACRALATRLRAGIAYLLSGMDEQFALDRDHAAAQADQDRMTATFSKLHNAVNKARQ